MPLDRPDRLEILQAVETLLDRDIKPRIDGPQGYHLRIAINMLRILRRELEASSSFERVEREGLEALVGELTSASDEGEALAEANAELCARIRDGRIAYDDPALREHLRATVMAKIAIDQPKYPSYLDILAKGWPTA